MFPPNLDPGATVRISELDGYRCVGVVKAIERRGERRLLRVKNCRSIDSGVTETGDQFFSEDKVIDVEVVSPSKASSSESSCASYVSALDSSDNVLKARSTGQPQPPAAKSKPESRKMLSNKDQRGDNPHLSRLYPIDMEDVLAQGQLLPAIKLAEIKSLPGKPLGIPIPEQTTIHQDGQVYRGKVNNEFVKVREIYWRDPETPPPLGLCPTKLYFVDEFPSKKYDLSMEILGAQRIVGVGLEGRELGRRGQLSLISFSTSDAVLMFDVVKLGPELFQQDLRPLLESPEVMKVFHDVRQASDALFHLYDIRLANVYDTLVSHALFMTTALYAGYLPTNAHSMTNLARAYLGISGTCLFHPHYRADRISEDSNIWMERPLSNTLLVGATRNVMYLLDLQRATRQCMNSHFVKGVECFLRSTRDADDHDAAYANLSAFPKGFVGCLPDWRPMEHKAAKWGVVERDKRRVHNSVGQMDPNIVFSRDVMHQCKKPNK